MRNVYLYHRGYITQFIFILLAKLKKAHNSLNQIVDLRASSLGYWIGLCIQEIFSNLLKSRQVDLFDVETLDRQTVLFLYNGLRIVLRHHEFPRNYRSYIDP